MMTQDEHESMTGDISSTIQQIRDAIQGGDVDSALSLLDQLEQQQGDEENAEKEGLEGQEENPEENTMPDSVARFAGYKR